MTDGPSASYLMNTHVLDQAACQVCAKLDSARLLRNLGRRIFLQRILLGRSQTTPDVPGKVLVEIHPE